MHFSQSYFNLIWWQNMPYVFLTENKDSNKMYPQIFIPYYAPYQHQLQPCLQHDISANGHDRMSFPSLPNLTHWGRVMHKCVNELTTIGSDNGLSPGRRQTIIWTNDGILLIGPLGTNFSEILFSIKTFSFNKMHLKMSSVKWHPFCLGLNVLTCIILSLYHVSLWCYYSTL